MAFDWFGIIFIYILVIIFAIPLGKYMAHVYLQKPSVVDFIFNPLEKLIYTISGIAPQQQQSWKQQLGAFLSINAIWLIISLLVLTNMASLPLNPDHIASMSWDLAWNTSISFVTNTNLQHYSGETQLSYAGQMVLMLWQFLSAACGMAITLLVIRSMVLETNPSLGNFYVSFVRTITRILLPLCFIVAIILIFQGVPMTFLGHDTITTLTGETQEIYRGPMAAFEAIKQLGTNGGGFFNSNAAHPFSNPTYLTNMLENLYIVLIPVAFIFMIGYFLKKPKFATITLTVMSIGFLCLLIPSLIQETHPNPTLQKLDIEQPLGNLEGKEIRFGSLASANWAVSTTCTSNGSTNSSHDSNNALTGMFLLLGMMINCFFGGAGVGFLNYYCYIILSVFIGGLMVGRTPEFLGKKIQTKEMKIVMLIVLLHPFLILVFTAISTFLFNTNPAEYASWLSNTGFHGFSEILYQFSSASSNNGSSFEGLKTNTHFWNYTTALVMTLARYLLIIGPVALAASLAKKKYIPESNGTLPTDNLSFAIMIFSVILILVALIFFPVLIMGPLCEYFSIH